MYPTQVSIFWCIISVHLLGANCMVGFDCSDPKVKISKYSLLDLPDCSEGSTHTISTPTTIQILQRKQYMGSTAVACLIEAISTIYYCGMHSHISLHPQGLHSHLIPLSSSECQQIIRSRQYNYEGVHQISQLTINETTSVSFTARGTVGEHGACTGTSWTSGQSGRTYSSSVQQVSLQITLKTFQVLYAVDKSGVRLPTGMICPNLSEGCFDPSLGYIFFDGLSADDCGPYIMDVLYEGPANLSEIGVAGQKKSTMVTVDAVDTTLALRLKTQTTICHHLVYDTELPDLFVAQPSLGLFYFRKGVILPENMKAFSYINSKMAAFEHHMARQIQSLADRASLMYCTQEREQLKTLLTLARISPEEFAFQFLDQRQGVHAQTAGEIVVVIECPPTTVAFRQNPDFCTDELPVVHNNRSRYLLPRSRILTDSPTLRECTALAPSVYKFDAMWVSTDHALVRVEPPATISFDHSDKMIWTYDYLTSWVGAGIYKPEDLKRFEQRMLGSHIIQGVSSSLARSMISGSEFTGPYMHDNLIPEATAVRVLKKGWNTFWSGISVFGTYVATLLGVYWIFLLIKTVISMVVNIKLVHDTVGWSWKMVYGVFGFITKLFLHKQQQKVTRREVPHLIGDDDEIVREFAEKARV